MDDVRSESGETGLEARDEGDGGELEGLGSGGEEGGVGFGGKGRSGGGGVVVGGVGVELGVEEEEGVCFLEGTEGENGMG